MNKIVLVEDDLTMLSLLQTLLQMEGFQVIRVNEEVPSIIDLLRSEKPALALIDVHLRQISGIELLTQIRSQPDLKDIRVIMSSGMNFTIECREAGADNFIVKPYMPDDLINMIRQTLSG
jgi:DNA-binding response OmpR family regulator